jgi:hypothetical protein
MANQSASSIIKLYLRANYFGRNIAENLFDLGLCLPSGSNLSQLDLQSVVENIKDLTC